MDDRLKTFRDSVGTTKAVVVCVKCGSTSIDQNFLNQLKCYECGNESIWDSSRFTISRDGDEHDAISGFEATKDTRDQNDFRTKIIDGLLPLMHRMSGLQVLSEGEGVLKIEKKDLADLTVLWGEARLAVDAVVEHLSTSKGAVYDL